MTVLTSWQLPALSALLRGPKSLGEQGQRPFHALPMVTLSCHLAWARALIFQIPLVLYRNCEISIAFSSLKKQL